MKIIKIRTKNVTSSGAEIPVLIKISPVDRDYMLQFMEEDKSNRNNWCTAGKPCSKFGKRPCCPPKVKLFSDLKPKETMYVVLVKIELEDYYETYPNVRDSKSWCYFGMDGTHKMTRNIQNKISTSFDGQAFRVGGCLGCQFTKNGTCKRFAPALEATGINVVELAKELFGEDITWRAEKQPMDCMIAVGGIYTDEDITPSRFKEVVEKICRG